MVRLLCLIIALLAPVLARAATVEQGWDEQQSAQCASAIAAAAGQARHAARSARGDRRAPRAGGRSRPWPGCSPGPGRSMRMAPRVISTARRPRWPGPGWPWTAVCSSSTSAACRSICNRTPTRSATSMRHSTRRPMPTMRRGSCCSCGRMPAATGTPRSGFYHSRTPDLASDYRERVAAIAAGRVPPAGRFVPLVHAGDPAGNVADPAGRWRCFADKPASAALAARSAHD